MRTTLFVLALLALLCVIYAFRGGYIPARISPFGHETLERADYVPVITDWRIAALRSDRDACAAFFAGHDVEVTPVADRPIRDGCGWENAVKVKKLGSATLRPATMSCPEAAGIAKWMRHVVQPAAQKHLGTQVTKLVHFGSYSCRNIRNGRGNSHWRSEHATANALDVSGFELADGRRVSVLDDWDAPGEKSDFLRSVHRGACRYFRVVLGPNANALHHNHFHLDRGWLFSCR